MRSYWSPLRTFKNLSTYSSRLPFGTTSFVPNVFAGIEFRKDPLAFLSKRSVHNGSIRFKGGFTDFTLLTEPSAIRKVLVTHSDAFEEGKWTQRARYVMEDCLITLEGTPHRERRSLLQSSFSKQTIAHHFSKMVGWAEKHMARWRPGDQLDARTEMSALSLAITGEVLFEEEFFSEIDELVPALQILNNSVSKLPISRPALVKAREIVSARASRIRKGPVVDNLTTAGRSEETIRHEVISLMMASVDTTPATLAWAWYAIGRHPEIETALHEELARELGKAAPTEETVDSLKYLGLLLSEVLRLYPPVHFIDRRVLVDTEIEGTALRANDYILLSPLFTHRDERFYYSPFDFIPERWSDPNNSPPQLSYFPFGAGAHTCIGMYLAKKLLAAVIATIAQQWRLIPSPEIPLDPSPQTSRLSMTLESRQ